MTTIESTSNHEIPGMVSVIVPVYNRPRQLVDAVHSAVTQDYRPLEVLIVDDGSTDRDTPKAALNLAREHPEQVRVYRIDNSGPGLAREHGRRRARGEYIQYLDSDDVLLPGKFSVQVNALRTRPEADVAYGITLFRDARGRLKNSPHKDTGVARERMFPSFLNNRWWDTSTPLYRRRACEGAGPWTDLRLEEDWEYDCRVAATSGRLVHCAVPVSETRDHVQSRLCRGELTDPIRLDMRARAHQFVWVQACRAGLSDRHPEELGRFGQSLFLLARQCAAAGLLPQSDRLLELAAMASRGRGKSRFQIPIYRWLAFAVGHQRLARLTQKIDDWRSGPPQWDDPNIGAVPDQRRRR